MNKILLTGSSGMLGKVITEHFLQDNSFEIYGLDINPGNIHHTNFIEYCVNLADLKELNHLLLKIKPDVVIHAAAIVNLKLCEERPDLASQIHIEVSRLLAKNVSRIIYISTDSVFNGVKGNYLETDIPDPLNSYSKTKFLGENAVRANNSNHIVIRTNIFGFNYPLKDSLAEWALKSITNSEHISGFHDVYFNAIYIKHLATILRYLLETDFVGILNIGSKNQISKFEFVNYIAKVLNQTAQQITKCSIDEINSTIIRPKNTTLNTDLAEKLFLLPTVYEGINELIKDYQNFQDHERN